MPRVICSILLAVATSVGFASHGAPSGFVEVSTAELAAVRGGAICESAVVDNAANSGCTECKWVATGLWQKCSQQQVVHTCQGTVTTGFRPFCDTVVASCGGYAARWKNDTCTHYCYECGTNSCSRTFNTATTFYGGSGNCP